MFSINICSGYIILYEVYAIHKCLINIYIESHFNRHTHVKGFWSFGVIVVEVRLVDILHNVSVQCRSICRLHSVLSASPVFVIVELSTFMLLLLLLISMHSSHCRYFGVSCSHVSYVSAHCDGHSQHELHAHTGS